MNKKVAIILLAVALLINPKISEAKSIHTEDVVTGIVAGAVLGGIISLAVNDNTCVVAPPPPPPPPPPRFNHPPRPIHHGRNDFRAKPLPPPPKPIHHNSHFKPQPCYKRPQTSYIQYSQGGRNDVIIYSSNSCRTDFNNHPRIRVHHKNKRK